MCLTSIGAGVVMHGAQGNGTSVLHRFPYAGINFFCYEHLKAHLREGETPSFQASPNLIEKQALALRSQLRWQEPIFIQSLIVAFLA